MRPLFLVFAAAIALAVQPLSVPRVALAQVVSTPPPTNSSNRDANNANNNVGGILTGLVILFGFYELTRPHHPGAPAPGNNPQPLTTTHPVANNPQATPAPTVPPPVESAPPPSVTENLRELNNKLARTIKALQGDTESGSLDSAEIERLFRTYDDLERTRMRAFEEWLGPSRLEQFKQFDCVGKEFKIGRDYLKEIERHRLGHWLGGKGRQTQIHILRLAKNCKERLEVLLQTAP